MLKSWRRTTASILGKNTLRAFTLIEVLVSVLITTLLMVSIAGAFWTFRIAENKLADSLKLQENTLQTWLTLDEWCNRVQMPWWSDLRVKINAKGIEIPGIDGIEDQILLLENTAEGQIRLVFDKKLIYESTSFPGTLSLWPNDKKPQGLALKSSDGQVNNPLIFRFGSSPW